MLKPRSAFSLAATVALLAVISPGQPLLRSAVMAATSSFEVPVDVPDGTQVRVGSGSDAMTAISQSLKTSFEKKFDGANVSVDAIGVDQAINAVLSGDRDLAAISRPLSDAEIAQGLAAENVKRIKIAAIIGAKNPFTGSLTGEQFAQIFRGEITNWSEVGGPDAPIRFIDRPDVSDTRLSLSAYPVFKTAEFATGETATQVSTDTVSDIANELGTDGISYALFSEVENRADVRVLAMHKTLPTDARYPFSQPFSFVYKGVPSPGVSAFLGYAAGDPGRTVLGSVNPFSGVVDAAGNALKAAPSAAGDVAQDAANAAGSAVTGTVDAAGNVAESASDAAQGAVDVAGDAAQGAAGVAGDAVQGVANVAGDAAQGAAGVAGDAVQGIAESASGAAQGGADAVGNTADAVGSTANVTVGDRNPRSQYGATLWWLLLIPAVCLAWVAFAERRRRQSVAAGAADSYDDSSTESWHADADQVSATNGAVATGRTAWTTAQPKSESLIDDGVNASHKIADDSFDAGKNSLNDLGNGVRDSVNNTADTLADRASDVANQAKRQASHLKSQAEKLGRKGIDTAADIADNLNDQNR